jgi:hypothetical protein
LTGKVASDFPTISYQKSGANAKVTISLSDLAALTTAYSSGGIKEISDGKYRLDLPDAALTTATRLSISGYSTGKAVICGDIDVQYVQSDLRQAVGQNQTLDANNALNVSAKYWAGTLIVATSVPVGTAAGVANGLPKLDANQYVGANIRQVVGQDVSSDGQGSLYTIPVTADGNATPLGLTIARVARLDNLDATVASRMATFTLPTNFSSLSIDSSGLVGLFASQSFNNSGQSTALPANVTKWLSQTPRALK